MTERCTIYLSDTKQYLRIQSLSSMLPVIYSIICHFRVEILKVTKRRTAKKTEWNWIGSVPRPVGLGWKPCLPFLQNTGCSFL